MIGIMKKTNFLRSIATIAMFLVAGMGVFAQITSPSNVTTPKVIGGLDSMDFATVGSVMPYQVTPDAAIANMVTNGMMNASVYHWTVSGGVALSQWAGGALTQPTAPDNVADYYTQNQVAAAWASAGIYTLTVAEKSRPLFGLTGCEGNSQYLYVRVVNRPTVAFPAAADTVGGCGIAGTNVVVPVNLTGTDAWQVTYQIDTINMTGGSGTFQASGASANLGTSTLSATTYANTENAVTLTTVAVPANFYGRMLVSITAVSDHISRKSGVSSTAADVPAVAARFVIYSLPTPVTQPIQHVTNL
jgi:hypothetical protein